MAEHEVSFFSEDVNFTMERADEVSSWIVESTGLYGKQTGNISIIFVSDDKLLEINKQYLNHHDYTDVITFDYTEKELVSGDIFISIDRVRENALELNEAFLKELSRVIIHGVLHLLGFNDKSDKERNNMRKEEEKLLNLHPYL